MSRRQAEHVDAIVVGAGIIGASRSRRSPGRRPAGWSRALDLATGVFLRTDGERLFGRANHAEPGGYRTEVDWTWLEPTPAPARRRFPRLADIPIHSIDIDSLRIGAWQGGPYLRWA